MLYVLYDIYALESFLRYICIYFSKRKCLKKKENSRKETFSVQPIIFATELLQPLFTNYKEQELSLCAEGLYVLPLLMLFRQCPIYNCLLPRLYGSL